MARKDSQAAAVSAGSELTSSRIISQAARLSAPSGAGPMAKETEHWGQKQIRRAADFWRGRMPTVCAKTYTATDFCPDSISRLQRRQDRLSKKAPGDRVEVERKYCSGNKLTASMQEDSANFRADHPGNFRSAQLVTAVRVFECIHLRIKLCSRQKDSARALWSCDHEVATDPQTPEP